MEQSTVKLTMTIPEFAAATGISRGLAYDLAKQDRLPVKVLHIGDKRMVVSRKAVLALLEGKGNETS
jgi:predicted DNA-binding transcriptional regulator AlpA